MCFRTQEPPANCRDPNRVEPTRGRRPPASKEAGVVVVRLRRSRFSTPEPTNRRVQMTNVLYFPRPYRRASARAKLHTIRLRVLDERDPAYTRHKTQCHVVHARGFPALRGFTDANARRLRWHSFQVKAHSSCGHLSPTRQGCRLRCASVPPQKCGDHPLPVGKAPPLQRPSVGSCRPTDSQGGLKADFSAPLN